MDQTLADAQARSVRLEDLFVSSLPDIERVSRYVAQRHRLSRDETDDFCSDVNLAIIQGNYAVLSSFQGRSSLRTYLTTVIQRMFLDYRRRLWGKWRPSAEAQRRGPLALRLEILLYRDGLSFDDAVETLRTNFGCKEGREALAELAQYLPARANRRAMAEGVEDIDAVPAGELASPETQFEGASTSARAQSLIDEAMAALDPQDRIVLRMRFEDDISVADVARILKLDQKRLYRRIDDLISRFRKSLEERGLRWAEVVRIIERGQCHLCLSPLVPETATDRPSSGEVQA